TDIVNADPLLGPLQDNGGETETHALLDDSPAIDAGSDATCAAPPVDGEDQRGVARPIGPHCDIGAFESSGSALEADLALMAEASPSEVPVGSTVTYILTATNAGPDTAYGIALTATLPVSVTFVSADGDCLENGGTVVCALGNLDSTDEISVTISARAQAIGPATVSAVVRAVTYDPVMADNSSQATSTLVRGKTFLPYIERKA
ncbi:MAG TPA: DUF11 domain-containing protein, partial [candidate division Zixibacteria bacterium]|nr:DUF11 domain-containing protein [candidate division Zixibacteria bacterium]